jgi:hypothetical protein
MAFIHKVTNFDKIYGYKGDRPNIHFYETYVGAAIGIFLFGDFVFF